MLVQMNVGIHEEQRAKLEEIAKKDDRSVSSIVRRLIDEYLQKLEKGDTQNG
jgi:predicted transcriptional regulator